MNHASNITPAHEHIGDLRILAIAGSLRRESHNRRLLRAATELAPAGIRISLYDELAAIPMFDEDLEAATSGGPDCVRRLREAVAASHGLLIATPEYNQSMPGVLKNALDWLSRGTPEVLAGKPVATIGASAGRWGTRLAQASLRQVLNATESRVMPAPALYLAEAERAFDAHGRLTDARTRQVLESVLAALADWVARVGEIDNASDHRSS
jgi:chromate reductase